MKKIVLLVVVLTMSPLTSFSKVIIGTGKYGSSPMSLPLNNYYGYSYGQSIFLASEVNASGDITSIILPQVSSGGGYANFQSRGNITFYGVTQTCLAPSDLTASNETITSADLGWTENGTASKYNVEVVTAGTPPTTIATDTGVANGFTKTGLSLDTDYEFYVQADCTVGDLSSWVGPYAFKTPCNAVNTFPWTEDFEGITTGQPICWGIAGTTTSASHHFNSYHSGYSGRGMRFDSFFNSTGSTSELSTPELDLSGLTTAELKFWYKNPTGGDFEILISTDAGASFTSLESGLTGQSDWIEKTYDITTYIDSDVMIQFKGTSNYGSGDAIIYLDEVTVETTLLLISAFENQSLFTYYPNPVKHTLSLNAQSIIDNVTLYNMLGQVILTVKPNAVESELDMSGLNTGLYFLKVSVGGISKTVNIIKQ